MDDFLLFGKRLKLHLVLESVRKQKRHKCQLGLPSSQKDTGMDTDVPLIQFYWVTRQMMLPGGRRLSQSGWRHRSCKIMYCLEEP